MKRDYMPVKIRSFGGPVREETSRAVMDSIQDVSIESMAARHAEIFEEILRKRMEVHG